MANIAIPSQELDMLLTDYFISWRPYRVILLRLQKVHGIYRSLRWLKSQFSRLNLRRRCQDPPQHLLCRFIREISSSSESLRGYRGVWKILRDRYGVIVRRDVVMQVLQEIDPQGVSERSSRRLKRRVYKVKGPNHMWHVDGYDKLTPFGITVHGCIDGYSRKLLWLKIGPTNRNPRVIAKYYLECVKHLGGCPSVLRCDYGTENVSLAAVQIAFRLHHSDSLAGEKSFVYGPSKHNIRIEAFWSQLRRLKTGWWIDFCKGLQEDGHFNGSILHRQCLAFTVVPLLRKELDEFVDHWNTHPIRKSQPESPGGFPDDMFDVPEQFGGEDCLQQVDRDLWTLSSRQMVQSAPAFYPPSFRRRATRCIRRIGFTPDTLSVATLKAVYLYLISNI